MTIIIIIAPGAPEIKTGFTAHFDIASAVAFSPFRQQLKLK
jgi:hypothetical protein